MRWFGDVDLRRNPKVIKVNKKKGDVLDTIVHERAHIQHPQMSERGIIKLAARRVGKLTRSQKKKFYNKV